MRDTGISRRKSFMDELKQGALHYGKNPPKRDYEYLIGLPDDRFYQELKKLDVGELRIIRDQLREKSKRSAAEIEALKKEGDDDDVDDE